jgi:hypothetical protein
MDRRAVPACKTLDPDGNPVSVPTARGLVPTYRSGFTNFTPLELDGCVARETASHASAASLLRHDPLRPRHHGACVSDGLLPLGLADRFQTGGVAREQGVARQRLRGRV